MGSSWITPTTLHDPRLTPWIRLVPLEPRHASDFFRVADPELFAHGTQNPPEWSERGFEQEIERVLGMGDVTAFAIELTMPRARAEGGFHPAGAAIGRTAFMDIRAPHRGVEIGRTWIAREFHGTFVNPASKYLLLRHAFEALSPGALRVQITTSSTNSHSQRAIEKLGATREGVLRHARILPPIPSPHERVRRSALLVDWICYSILAEEWGSPAGPKSRLESRLQTYRAT